MNLRSISNTLLFNINSSLFSNRSYSSGVTNSSFDLLLEQALLQAELNKKITNKQVLNAPFPLELGSVTQSKVIPSNTDSTSLNTHLKGVLQNTGDYFVAAGKKYQINPALLAAISIHETGNGTSNAARFKYNVAGMMGKNGLKTYSSIQESIFDMARNLRENYLDKGKLTIEQIGAKYAPIGAANDPTQLNNHWVKGVQRHLETLTKTDFA